MYGMCIYNVHTYIYILYSNCDKASLLQSHTERVLNDAGDENVLTGS
jgi:hypothetical protein